ncbi:unannotated protein [freshwater metagenome]|uniref:Unannotated protein n=1 Tax=freshwater metagenome TaxID=449393 RepID=A0A6J7MMX6_9ZZZZ
MAAICCSDKSVAKLSVDAPKSSSNAAVAALLQTMATEVLRIKSFGRSPLRLASPSTLSNPRSPTKTERRPKLTP